MKLRKINMIIGLSQIFFNIFIIIPLTINIIINDGGAFGFGYLFLPIVLPLSVTVLFGFIGLINYMKDYNRVRKLIIAAHILTAVTGLTSYFIMPLYPFYLISIPIAYGLVTVMAKENIGRLILITNGLVLLCIVSFTFLIIA